MNTDNNDNPFSPSDPNNLNDFNKYWNKKRLDDELDDYFKDLMPKKRTKLMDRKITVKNIPKCSNPSCNHKKYIGEEEILWHKSNEIKIQSIDNLRDLIELGKTYHCGMRKYFNGIDIEMLFDITEHLEELDKMIGLTNIKEEIVNLIIHLLLLKYKNEISNNSTNMNINKITNTDMLHCVITGSPGCGKTTLIEIYAKILTKLGITKTSNIVKVKRSDLIGKYLGHTATQTQKKIDEAKGGILLIDEAYSLGNPEQRDSFSKECLDTLNQALSENKQDFICIIAGYANALDASFFAYNEGLRRRFPFRFDIQPYTHKELTLILEKKINEYGTYNVQFKSNELNKLIKKNFSYFKHQGGDMETLFLNIKISHNKRTFLLPGEEKSNLFLYDIENSIEKFIKLKGNVKQ